MYSLNTLQMSSPSLVTSLLLSCPWSRGSWFHHHSIRLDSADKSCEGLHKQQWFCWQMKSYFPAISPVYANNFLASQKCTLLQPWHQTKLYRKLFPLDLSLRQEMVFEAKRQVGMHCLQLDWVWYHYPQFVPKDPSESDCALQDQILYYFVELSHHAYCLESQMQSQGSVSCHRQ